MEEYVFGTYAQLLKDAWRGRVSQTAICRTLYDAVLYSVSSRGVTTSDKAVSNSGKATKLFKRQDPVHNDVVTHKDDPAVRDEICDYFDDNITCKLEQSRINDLKAKLVAVIDGSNRPQDVKDELIGLSEEGSLSVFLSSAYLESLARGNKAESRDKRRKMGNLPPFDATAYNSIEVPEDITPEESKYVRALLDAYGDAEGVESVELEFLNSHKKVKKYKRHFSRQRQDYFNADFVRHSTRASSGIGGDGPFNDLEIEIRDGIIDIYEDDFPHGLERLKRCLEQAALVPVARSWIKEDPEWLSVSVKKGVCHILVNEDILEGWVRHAE